MGIIALILLAIGLSMDAFAVSICKGLNMTKINFKHCTIVGLFFGGFQALMPLIGWFLGSQFQSYITSFDHWVAFALLAFIGGKMIYDSIKVDEDEDKDSDICAILNIKDLFILSIATSIDALAVGITFALLPNVNIWLSIATIGIITFALSFVGVIIGSKFGKKYEKRAEFLGGAILITLGIKILVEHILGL
ncbi:Putative Mn2+ efflux pump MntP [Hathewaya proteolytica DSM 3090]|uniref:Putative manganese efflux pump MntP n=1 Tax=Hathewaya proteolytica DSM 3090 TaxID=1121331 RepID=A0A1M6QXI8_9CLOT|nr:manganese efflux pump MntP family protein [Hathewaya proteolytica]SHK24808.1 Putative Mn2+ efflux pump MntP [Hathewaya proteolytica DSM 3090]